MSEENLILLELREVKRYVHGIRNMMIVLMIIVLASVALSVCGLVFGLLLAYPTY